MSFVPSLLISLTASKGPFVSVTSNPLFFLIKNSPSVDSDILLNALYISIISLENDLVK